MTLSTVAQTGARQGKRAAASFLGAMLEYYDLYIYASASALIFNRIFFPAAGAATGLLLSLGTFAIGCLPTYDSIGLAAPLLLVICRLLQGVSVGGEAAGGTTLTLEHAPAGRRGLFTSWTVNGIQAGFILASVVFIPISALPEHDLLTWGWRVPFWSSLLIVVVAFVVRRTLAETDAFLSDDQRDESTRPPIAELFRTHRAAVVRVAVSTLLVVISSTVPVWGLSYAKNTIGIDATTMLWVVVFGYAAALVFQPLFAHLSDRIGRKPVFIAGNIGGALTCFVFFDAVASQDVFMMCVGIFLSISLFYSAVNATYPAFFAEMFNVRVRYSGVAIGLQVGLVVAGFAPALSSYWVDRAGGTWLPAALLTVAACLASAIAAATAKETFRTPLHELGEPMR